MLENLRTILVATSVLFMALLAYGIVSHNTQIVWGKKGVKDQSPPFYRKGTIVSHRCSHRMQVLKIRRTETGSYEYKIRHYNSLWRGYWVPERELGRGF